MSALTYNQMITLVEQAISDLNWIETQEAGNFQASILGLEEVLKELKARRDVCGG